MTELEKRLADGYSTVYCKSCKNIIQSTHRHDCKSCPCGATFVDGGRDYMRVGGDIDNIVIINNLETFKKLEKGD